MAWTGPIRDQQFNSATSATTFTFSPTVTIPVGTLVILSFCRNTTGAMSTVADNSVQAGTANVYTHAADRTGTTLRGNLWFCVTTRSILNTNTITGTLGGTASRRSAKLLTFTGQDALSPFDVVFQEPSPGGTSIAIGPTGTLAGSNELVLGCSWWRGGAVLSGWVGTGTGYTQSTTQAGSGGVTTRVESNVAFKTNAGPAAETNTHTFTTAAQSVGAIIAFKMASGTVFAQGVSGAVSFVGAAPKKSSARRLPSALSFVGVRTASPTGRRVTGAFTPAGSLTGQASLFRTLVAALGFSGSVSRATARLRTLVGAVFTPTGAVTTVKAVSKAVSGALTFVGASTRIASKALAAGFTPAGALARTLTLFRALSGAVAFAGSLKRSTSRKVLGAAQFVGMVITNQVANHLFAAFQPTGTVSNGLPARTLYAALSFSTSMLRFTTRRLVASLIASGVMHTQYIPPVPAGSPGGGGYGALMSDAHFERYVVDAKWRHMKRVKA